MDAFHFGMTVLRLTYLWHFGASGYFGIYVHWIWSIWYVCG